MSHLWKPKSGELFLEDPPAHPLLLPVEREFAASSFCCFSLGVHLLQVPVKDGGGQVLRVCASLDIGVTYLALCH